MMSNSTFSVFSNIFGFVVAVISLFAFLINICRSHLPSNRIKELELLMDETETVFKKAVEDGLLIEPEFVRQTERHLTMLRILTHRLQSRAYNATTLRRDYLELLKGTSQAIGTTCQSLKELRAQVIVRVFNLEFGGVADESRLSRRAVRRDAVDFWRQIQPSTLLLHPFSSPSPIPSAILAHYFPLRFLDPVRVPQYSQNGDWMMCDMALLKGIHSIIPLKVIQTYKQLTHEHMYQLFVRLSPPSLEFERKITQQWRSRPPETFILSRTFPDC